MNKGKLAILAVSGSLLVILSSALVIKLIDNKVINSDKGSISQTETGLVKIEDIRDNMTEDTVSKAVESLGVLNEKFNIIEGREVDFQSLGPGRYREVESLVYSGKAKDSSGDTFELRLSSGIDNTPGITFSIATTSLSQSEVEDMLYQLTKDTTSDEVLKHLKDLPYGEGKLYEINLESGYNDVYISKNKVDMDSVDESYQSKLTALGTKEDISEADLENLGEPVYVTKTSYTYGVEYSEYNNVVKNGVYQYKDFDRKLFKASPIFNDGGSEDIATSSILDKYSIEIGNMNTFVRSYSARSLGNKHSNSLTFEYALDSGDKIASEVTWSTDDSVGETNISFDTRTRYFKSKQEALDNCYTIIKAFTGNEYKDLESISENTYLHLDDVNNSMISIEMIESKELGWYGKISYIE